MRSVARTAVFCVLASISGAVAAHDGSFLADIVGMVILSLIPGGILGWLTGLRSWRLVFSVPGALTLFAAFIALIEILSVRDHSSSYEHYTEDMIFLGSAAIFPFLLIYGVTYALGVWKRKTPKATPR